MNEDRRDVCFRCRAELPPAKLPASPLNPETGAYGPPPPPPVAPEVAAGQQRFLRAFSFGVGCPLYFFSRSTVREGVMVALWWASKLLCAAITFGADPQAHAAILATAIQNVLGLIGLFFLMASGGRARRQRWERLPWHDCDHFRRAEGIWATAGVCCIGTYLLLSFLI
jgi:hypothetical protein